MGIKLNIKPRRPIRLQPRKPIKLKLGNKIKSGCCGRGLGATKRLVPKK